MDRFEDAFYRVGRFLTSPREAFYIHLVEKHPLSLPLLIYAILSFSLSSLSAKSVFALMGLPGIVPEPFSDIILEFSGLAGTVLSISLLILYAALVHLTARIIGYTTGKWEEVLCAAAYSILPQSSTAFIMSLSYLLLSYELLLTSIVLLVLACLWSLYIMIEETSVIYDSSIVHSVLISIAGPLLLTLISLGLISVMGIYGLVVELVAVVALYYWRVSS